MCIRDRYKAASSDNLVVGMRHDYGVPRMASQLPSAKKVRVCRTCFPPVHSPHLKLPNPFERQFGSSDPASSTAPGSYSQKASNKLHTRVIRAVSYTHLRAHETPE